MCNIDGMDGLGGTNETCGMYLIDGMDEMDWICLKKWLYLMEWINCVE